MTGALLDCLTHHVHILEMNGESYRLRQSKARRRMAPMPIDKPLVDAAMARPCARLYGPDPRAERDALIAATALVHRMMVVTRNVADFAPMGVPIFNP